MRLFTCPTFITRIFFPSYWGFFAGALLLATGTAIFKPGIQGTLGLAFAAGAWINLLTGVASPGQRTLGDVEAGAQLAVDILQISALMFLTGGTAFVPAVRRLFESRFGAVRIGGGGEFVSVAEGLALLGAS